MFDLPLLTCRNLATLCSSLQAKSTPVSQRTSFSKASSVPEGTQTAILGSSTDTKPRVIVWESPSIPACHQLSQAAMRQAPNCSHTSGYSNLVAYPRLILRIDDPSGDLLSRSVKLSGEGESTVESGRSSNRASQPPNCD